MAVWQRERGEQGTPHLQGYLEFKNKKSMRQVKEVVGLRAHVQWCRPEDTRKNQVAYCSKEETREKGPWYYPNADEVKRSVGITQGTRTDVKRLVEFIRAGNNELSCWQRFPRAMARYSNLYSRITRLHKPPRVDKERHKVTLLLGEPGTGKTRWVNDNYPDCWETPIDAKGWFDGYDRHEEVLFDDFTGANCAIRLDSLLKLLDIYPRQTAIKGGFRWWAPHRVFITSNVHPRYWYKWEGREILYRAFQRRIDVVRVVFRDGTREYTGTEFFKIDPEGFTEFTWGRFRMGGVLLEMES